MVWAQTIGDAALAGYDAIFREPRLFEIITETPVIKLLNRINSTVEIILFFFYCAGILGNFAFQKTNGEKRFGN